MNLKTPPLVSRRRDWFNVLRDLQKAGVSYREVARKCCKHVGAVQNWAEGGDPKDVDARVVMALYAKYCPEKFVAHQALYQVTEVPTAPDGGDSSE